MMRWLIRGFPAAVIMLTAVYLGLVGALLPIGAAATNGPGSGQISIGFVAMGGALILLGMMLLWVAWGVWRARRVRTLAAIVFSAAVVAYLVLVAPGAFTSRGSFLNSRTGDLEPQYDTGAQLLVLAIVPYAVALVCLVIAEGQERRASRQH